MTNPNDELIKKLREDTENRRRAKVARELAKEKSVFYRRGPLSQQDIENKKLEDMVNKNTDQTDSQIISTNEELEAKLRFPRLRTDKGFQTKVFLAMEQNGIGLIAACHFVNAEERLES